MLLLEGPPGSGKSVLAAFAALLAKSRNWQVVGARVEAGAAGCRWVVTPEPSATCAEPSGLGTGSAVPLSQGSSAASLIDVLRPLGKTAPCLLILEDVHRLEEAALEGLRLISDRLDPAPVVVLMTARCYPVSAQLAALRWALDPAAFLAVGPLPEAVLRTLAERELHGALGPGLISCLSQVGGNPGFLGSFLQTLRRHRSITWRTTPGGPSPIADLNQDLPRQLWEDLVVGGWDLSPETRYWLKLASVLGPRFSLRAFVQLTGRHAADLLTLLEEALAAGVLEERGGEVAFRAELYQKALYATVPGALKAELHRDAAKVLEHLEASPEAVGWHLVRAAGSGSRQETVAWFRKNAADLVAASPHEAADLLAKSVALCSPTDADFPELVADAAAAWVAVGEVGQAERLCRQALGHVADARQRSRIRGYLVEALLHRCQLSLAAQTLKDEEEIGAVEREENLRAEATAALIRLLCGETRAVAQQVPILKARSVAGGDRLALSRALLVDSLVREREGDLGAALRLAAEASALGETAGEGSFTDPFPASAQAMFLMDLDQFGAAQALLRRQGTSQRAWWPFMRFLMGFSWFWSGTWTRAAREFEAGIGEALHHGAGWRVAARGLYALICYGRGDKETAREWMAIAEAEWASGDRGYRVGWFLLAKILIAHCEGAVDEAAYWASRAESLSESGGVWATIGPWVVHHGREDQKPALAYKVLGKLEAMVARTPTALGASAALHAVRGMVLDDPTMLAQAAAIYAKSGRLFEQALACEGAAWVFARRGEEDRAREQLRVSLGCFERLGSDVLAKHARNRLASEGVRLTVGRTRPITGWEAITASELRVLRLIVQRRTNPEIAVDLAISRRTVETHVSHLLSKLGVESRWQLAEEAARHFGWHLSLKDSQDA
ncbi:MAG: LuxR C-terminal-related transcriptional regulator [Firmicutes bacterium]|nr:hypothetical protein [Alicyclobacillaceae bacterium]MCL6496109.1 LuxR C-terminal-related transcriptional regulator [Bacillota bacterium]